MLQVAAIRLLLNPAVKNLLEQRGIGENAVEQVVHHAEQDGSYHQEEGSGHRLACLTTGSVAYWVEYLQQEAGYQVLKAYTHRMKILHGFNMPSKKVRQQLAWQCGHCGIPLEMAAVKMTYLGENFIVDLPACPSCQQVLIDEETATVKMALAEQMLEDK